MYNQVMTTNGKTRISIFIDDDVLDAFRRQAGGRGYQTLMNEALRQAMVATPPAITIETLRQVVREELQSAKIAGEIAPP